MPLDYPNLETSSVVHPTRFLHVLLINSDVKKVYCLHTECPRSSDLSIQYHYLVSIISSRAWVNIIHDHSICCYVYDNHPSAGAAMVSYDHYLYIYLIRRYLQYKFTLLSLFAGIFVIFLYLPEYL